MKPIRFYLPLLILMCFLLGSACTKDVLEPVEAIRETNLSHAEEAFDHAVDRGTRPAVDPTVPVKSKRIIKPLPPEHPVPRKKRSREAFDPSNGRD